MKKVVKKVLRTIVYSPPVNKLAEASKKLILPGFGGMPLYDVADFFFTGIQKGAIKTRASSVAYSFFLALFPAIIFLFSLIPYIPIKDFQPQLLLLLQDIFPKDAYVAARSTIEDIVKHQRGGLLSLGFVLVIYFTTNGISALIDGFNKSYHIKETRTGFKQRMVALFLTAIISLLVIAAIVIIITSEAATQYLVTTGLIKSKGQIVLFYLGKWLVTAALFLFAISFLYYFGPAQHKRWRFFSAGSILASFLSILTSVGFGAFVNNFGSYNKLYGSIGTLIVIMLWIYYNALILIIGFELNASIGNAKSSRKSF
ncbi:MAG TPA: YihY/virulence factor BrkB family protein [Bacteroidia bacterium]|nr:YihY/virulence factor BrkB family protein [Bacteroidia bacterium]